MIKFRNTVLKMQYEAELERMKKNKYLALDRHELTKLLEKHGIEVFDVDTDESLREKAAEIDAHI